ncbi:MAG: patatin-like phospholipase family protein [Verrucomicrobiota bacterium]|jgi:NTE family protein|nr:patatin-like phospholipase family protein [Verrucomicrobiota bacterium]
MLPLHHPPCRIGLALGSGGARGWAHLGVLARLRELGVPIHCIAGTSIGAIVGALYASDSLATMRDLATHLDWKSVARLFLEVNLPRSGLISGKNFMRLLKDVIPARQFSDLALPCSVVATDLLTETEVVLDSGSLFDAIRASIAIPGVFTPMRLHGRHLVDGGLTNPLPVSVCRAMGADVVIAVDINLRCPPPRKPPRRVLQPAPAGPSASMERLLARVGGLMPQWQESIDATVTRLYAPKKQKAAPLSIFDVLTRSFRVVENQLTRHGLALAPPDILIQPEVGHITTLDFHRGPEAIAAGRAAVDEILPGIVRFARPWSHPL